MAPAPAIGARWTLGARYAAALIVGGATWWVAGRYGSGLPGHTIIYATLGSLAGILVAGGFGPAALCAVLTHLSAATVLLGQGKGVSANAPGAMVLATSLALWLIGAWVSGRARSDRRRLAERERAAQEGAWRYRLLLEEASDAIVVFDDTLHVQMVNGRATELLGRTRESMLGMACHELLRDAGVAPDESATPDPAGERATARDCLLREAIESGRPTYGERTLLRPDGRRFVGELSTRALPDGSVQVIVRDVTIRHDAAEALRAERDLLGGIIATSTSAILAIDAETHRVVFANRRFSQVTGIKRSDVSRIQHGKGPWASFDEEGRPIPPEALPFRRVLQSGKPVFGYPLVVRFPDGREHRVRVNAAPLRDASGRLTTVVQTVDDVTERLQTERALEASEAKLQHIAQAFPGAMYQFCLEPSGTMRFTYCSVGVRELLGLTADEAVRDFDRVWRCIAPELRDEVLQTTLLSAATGQPWRMDLRVTTVDGRLRWLRGTAYPEAERVEGVVRWNGVFVDVTEFKELESHLLQSQKMEGIGRLAGGIAHDFNNILTAIRGNVDLLLDELSTDDDRSNELAEIRDAAERAGTLTAQLLAFSRKQFQHPRELDLNALVRDMEKMLRRVIGEDISLLTAPGDALGMVRADAGQLQQVLLNLVVNARDAMPEGGLLAIDTRNVRLSGAAAAAAGLAPGDYVCLVVRDTGHGMTPEVQARIFEPFFTTRPQGRGTGLGLAMVYGIVQQSGGAVTVESEPARGSTFRLYFPRLAATREALTSPPGGAGAILASPTGASAPNGSILLVEDDPGVRQLATRLLARAGYDVRTAADAYEALTMADAACSGIDLVISDVVMPGMGGRELSLELRRRRPDLKLLFISGYLDLDGARLGLNRRTRLLHKPFTQEGLLQTVHDLLALPIPA
jgi:PAS domain S-box-containing protein